MKIQKIDLYRYGAPKGTTRISVSRVVFAPLVVLASAPETIIAFAPARDLLPAGNEVIASGEFVWMPAGKHSITAGTTTGKPFVGEVIVDEQGFRAVEASFARTMAAGRPAWIDFNHNDADAAAWVKGFKWDASRGIIASVEWTPKGRDALDGKQFRSFSPAFTLDRESKRVTGIYEGHAAGGLVNAPAFGAAMPALIAARLGGADSTNPAPGGFPGNQKTNTMKDLLIKILAALAVTHAADATEEQLSALLASHVANKAPNPEVAALKLELEAIKAASASQATELATIKAAKPAPVAAAPVVVSVVPAEPAVVASVKPNAFEAIRAMQKEPDHRKRGAIYCEQLREFTAGPRVLEILAANSLGTVTSDLVVLRALDLLKLNFPALSRVTTDYSAENAKYGQAVKTRIVSVPTVGTYNTTTGYGLSDVTTTDVSVTINNHKHVTIGFNANEASGTSRDLFGEQVEAMNYALGKNMVDALYALFVIGTYTNSTTVAAGSVTRITVPLAIASALNARGVPMIGRTLLLSSATFAKLAEDSTIMNLAAYQSGDLITEYQLPKIAGLQPIEAVNLPTTGNMTGFAFTKDAAAIATRLPADYTQALPGAAHGAISVVTNPDTGISVLKTDFVDHTLGGAYSRIAWMYGVAAGQVASGQILKTS